MTKNKYIKEQEYLDNVIPKMTLKLDQNNEILSNKRESIINTRKEMFNETTNIIRDFDDVINLNSINELLTNDELDFISLNNERKRIQDQLRNPYFARFDYKQDDANEYQKLYIGKYGFYNKNDFTFYVYDWRTPIASLYYDNDLGRASYEAPKGILYGDINLKRQYNIKNAKVEFIYETEALSQDKILSDILSKNADGNLKVIISSIQKDQNAAIRHSKTRNVIILGPAGSGKTSVGLHRLAYILYQKRDSLISEDIAIVSNSKVFISYISNTIPELGEEQITQYLFDDLAKIYLPEDCKKFSYFHQLTHLENIDENDIRIKSIKIKNSQDFYEYINEYFTNFKFNIKDLTYEGKLVCDKNDIKEVLINNENYSFDKLLDRLYYYIEIQYTEYFIQNKEMINQLSDDKSYEFLTSGQITAQYTIELNSSIQNTITDFNKINEINEFTAYLTILNKYIQDRGFDNAVFKQTKDNIDKNQLLHEDGIIVLYLKLLLKRINQDSKIKHVLIDEAQDYTYLQLAFLKKLYSKADFTILADINQSINKFTSINKDSDFTSIFDNNTSLAYLEKSYRSTTQINKLSLSFLDKDNRINYFNRDGELPTFHISSDINLEIVKLIKHANTNSTLAVITDTIEKSVILYDYLSDKVDIQLVSDDSSEISNNFCIIPLVLAKGLEFNTVIIPLEAYDKNSTWKKNNIMYFACTRALHDLHLIGDTALIPLFDNSIVNIVNSD